MGESELRCHALMIWTAAVEAVKPEPLVEAVFRRPEAEFKQALDNARRILVVGGGKAGAGMSAAVEAALADRLDRVEGIVNVPDNLVRPLKKIVLHPGRPAGQNEPTKQGVAGTEQMLRLLANASHDDIALCLISGGGSALLPAPVPGVSLKDKQMVTRLLSEAGANIDNMNCVRKHISRTKGGGFAETSNAGSLWGLIISDVFSDRLDIIASGPTAADPTTFSDAIRVLRRHSLLGRVPKSVRRHLEAGAAHMIADTTKDLPECVHNQLIGSNKVALTTARKTAKGLGYRAVNLPSLLIGEARQKAKAICRWIQEMQAGRITVRPPSCYLVGGETTVALPPSHGLGGRNQELVLAVICHLAHEQWKNVAVLCGGTDGEDGPTDAAGAVADNGTIQEAARLGLNAADFLARHDSYHFFDAVGGLIRTGLTGTNVADVCVILVGRP